jgi:hypothetical protein
LTSKLLPSSTSFASETIISLLIPSPSAIALV